MAESPPLIESLYQSGAQALQAGDRARARALWIQALQQNPRDLKLWIALTRTCDSRAEQLYCLIQSRRLLPREIMLEAAYRRFRQRHADVTPEVPGWLDLAAILSDEELAALPPEPDIHGPPPEAGLSFPTAAAQAFAPPEERRRPAGLLDQRQRAERIRGLLLIADGRLARGDADEALSLYLSVLELDPANADALAGALRLLSRARRLEEAESLTVRSIEAGNQDPAAYVSLAELRLRTGEGDPWEPLAALIDLPAVRPLHLLRAATLYWQEGRRKEGLAALHAAERRDPADQTVLMRLADAYRDLQHADRAVYYLRRVTDQGARTALGQAAEDALLDVAPHIPRYIQTSTLYALREVAGVVLIYFFLAVLDAGVTLTGIGLRGWGGLVLSAIGGYLAVTATSSPAQSLFGELRKARAAPPIRLDSRLREDYLPDPVEDAPFPILSKTWRIALGAAGAVILAVAAGLVLANSLSAARETLGALGSGVPPDYIHNWLTLWFRAS